jgi:hypothetical protein
VQEIRATGGPTQPEIYDAVLIGGGIMSATLGALLTRLQPDWSILVQLRLSRTLLGLFAGGALSLLRGAFARGYGHDVTLHTDADLSLLSADERYREMLRPRG